MWISRKTMEQIENRIDNLNNELERILSVQENLKEKQKKINNNLSTETTILKLKQFLKSQYEELEEEYKYVSSPADAAEIIGAREQIRIIQNFIEEIEEDM